MSKENLLTLYEVVKANPLVRDAINWEAFAREAEKVGLHYDKDLGLMDQGLWDVIKPLLKDRDTF